MEAILDKIEDHLWHGPNSIERDSFSDSDISENEKRYLEDIRLQDTSSRTINRFSHQILTQIAKKEHCDETDETDNTDDNDDNDDSDGTSDSSSNSSNESDSDDSSSSEMPRKKRKLNNGNALDTALINKYKNNINENDGFIASLKPFFETTTENTITENASTTDNLFDDLFIPALSDSNQPKSQNDK